MEERKGDIDGWDHHLDKLAEHQYDKKTTEDEEADLSELPY